MYSSIRCSIVKKKKNQQNKLVCLEDYRHKGLDSRLLTPFSLWLASIVAGPTYFYLLSQDLFYFSWTRVFVF